MDKNQSTKAVQKPVAGNQSKSKSAESKPKVERERIERETLNAYIGNNYQKITTRSYNIAAFFFQGFYLLYRRMFWAGVLLILAQFTVYGLVALFANEQTASWVFTGLYFVIGLILCFTFNKFYMAYVRKKIDIIRHRNPTIDDAGIRAICAENRHTSGLMVLGGFCIDLVIMIAINMVCYLSNIPSPYSTNEQLKSGDIGVSINIGGSDQSDNNTPKPSADDYNGSVTYNTAIDIANQFSLQVPDEFTDNSSAYRFQYNYALDQTDANQCEFTLGALRDFTDAQKLINQMASFDTQTPYKVQTSTINGQQWYWFSDDDSLFGPKYTYVTNKDGNIYLMTYQEPNNDQAPECAEFRQVMISSLKAS